MKAMWVVGCLSIASSACADKHEPRREDPKAAAAAARRAYFDDDAKVAAWLEDHLGKATAVVGYAIGPKRTEGEGAGAFHGYPIHSRVELDAAAFAPLRDALLASLDVERNGSIMCFNPHHALHVVEGKRWFDAIVCFECQSIQLWDSAGQFAGIDMRPPGARELFERALPDVP